MVGELDDIARFAKSQNLDIKPRTVFVEGTSDVDLFEYAAKLEKAATGDNLLGDSLAIVAAGEGEFGGVNGVVRQLITFKSMSGWCLLPSGRPKYKFVGLFDNDKAGRQGVIDAHRLDTSLVEYRYIYRLWPVMPLSTNLDPDALKREFEAENAPYSGMDWELEDLIPESFVDAFLQDCPSAYAKTVKVNGKTHRNWNADSKARLHRYIKDNALHADMLQVIGVLRALRHYLNIKTHN